jgi:hypothetical protein
MGTGDGHVGWGALTNDDRAHRQPRRLWRARRALLVVSLAAASLSLEGCGRSVASPTCTTKELIAAAGTSLFKLPPSHDNDAGRGRLRDAHPDADLDANQRAALCKVITRESHLPG